MYRDLREFVDALARAGELVRISAPVSAVLEVAAIADRVSKSPAPAAPSDAAKRNDPAHADRGGPALLFDNIEGAEFPLLINAFGSYRRMEMALGCERGGFDAIGARIGELVKPQPPRSLGEAIRKAAQFAPLLKIGPKRRRGAGPCQQVVRTGEHIDLTRLPLIRCWAHDGDFAALGYPPGINAGVEGLGHPGMSPDEWDLWCRGRYITFAGIHTIHADDAGRARPSSHNIGMYRLQLFGKDRLAMHWHMHHDGARHWRSWKKRGEPMPVAIAFGGESVLPYAATAPLPPGISELLMAGFLNGRGIEMVRAKTVPLWVPANAEIVIEGFVRTDGGGPGWEPDAGEPLGPGAVFEGPFGDHTGFYSLPDRYPIVEVTALTHRANAVLPATVVGLPPQEDYYLGKATERLFLPLLKVLVPDIEDYDLPMFGAFHNAAFVRIEKAYPLQGRRVMHSVWGAGQMAWTKSIFVVADGVDVHDQRAVLEAAARHCRPLHDVEVVRGPLDILDHAAPWHGAGSKIGFDCTPRWADEQAGGELPKGPRPLPEAAALDAYLERVSRLEGVLEAAVPRHAPGWLLIEADRGVNETGREGMGRRVLDRVLALDPGFSPRLPFVVVVGRGVDIHSPVDGLFNWLANMDPGRDLIRHRDAHGDCLAFDATPKTTGDAHGGEPVRGWPPVLAVDPATSERVLTRWGEYGLASENPR
jgi:4-hydroxy-3-polyprenylbenzoate decarboxylase